MLSTFTRLGIFMSQKGSAPPALPAAYDTSQQARRRHAQTATHLLVDIFDARGAVAAVKVFAEDELSSLHVPNPVPEEAVIATLDAAAGSGVSHQSAAGIARRGTLQ